MRLHIPFLMVSLIISLCLSSYCEGNEKPKYSPVEIFVEQDYGEAKEDFPLKRIATILLEGAGVKVIEHETSNNSTILKIVTKGKALTADYFPGGLRYSGVEIQCSFNLYLKVQNIPIYKKPFLIRREPPYTVGSDKYKTPERAPFFELIESETFYNELFMMISEVYGREALISAFKKALDYEDRKNYVETPYVLNSAAIILGDIKDNVAADILIDLLTKIGGGKTSFGSSQVADIQRNGILSLGKIGDNRAVEVISRHLGKYYRSDVRATAAEVLGEIGDQRAIKILTPLLEEKRGVVLSAAYALYKLGDASKIELLISPLSNPSGYPSDWWAEEAARLLGKTNDFRAVEPLISALGRYKKKKEQSRLTRVEYESITGEIVKALKNITKQDFGLDEVRWKEWWEKNKDKYMR